MPRARSVLLVTVGAAAALLLLYFSLARVNLRQVLAELGDVGLGWLVVSVGVRVGGLSVASWRSRVLLAPLRRFGFLELFKSLLLAFMVQNLIPLRAGDLTRVGYLARIGSLPKSSCLAVVSAEKLLDLLALMTLFFAVLPAVAIDLPMDVRLYVGLGVAVLAALGTVLVSSRPQRFVAFCATLGRLLGKTVGDFVETRSASFARGLAALASPRTALLTFALSVLYWLAGTLTLELWMQALDIHLPWYAPVVVLAFLAFGLAVPATPANVGTYHFLAFQAMTTLGVEATLAGSFALLAHAMTTVPMTVVGIVLLFDDLRRVWKEA
jgi:glycosyltransferase 2 family protein